MEEKGDGSPELEQAKQETNQNEIRLQKYLAVAGVASRRKSEELISSGRVKVNGVIINEMGQKVDPDKDIIEVDGKKVIIQQKKVYILLHKPEGYVTTVSDQFDRPTVMDLINGIEERVYPVGRLDYDTSGLLILTNDGDLTYRVTHPSHEMEKIYIAELGGTPTEAEMWRFRKGLSIEDYTTSPAGFKILSEKLNSTTVEITIHEGRNRQVRKMCEAIGHNVIRLKRVKVGPIELGDLKPGEWRHMNPAEIRKI